MASRTVAIAALLFLTSLALPLSRANAWGLVEEIQGPRANAFLPAKVLKNKAIRFCLNIADPTKFERQSQEAQIRGALDLWLRASGNESTTVSQVPCTQKDVDLWVDIGSEVDWPTHPAYTIAKIEGDRAFSYVKINSDFVWESHRILDFATVLPDHPPLESWLEYISIQSPFTLAEFADRTKIDELILYWTTYRIYIHEFGHSFGLCDTADGESKKCWKKHSSNTHPSSMMQDANYFYLTPDDIAGVQHAFKYYSSKCVTRVLGS